MDRWRAVMCVCVCVCVIFLMNIEQGDRTAVHMSDFAHINAIFENHSHKASLFFLVFIFLSLFSHLSLLCLY